MDNKRIVFVLVTLFATAIFFYTFGYHNGKEVGFDKGIQVGIEDGLKQQNGHGKFVKQAGKYIEDTYYRDH